MNTIITEQTEILELKHHLTQIQNQLIQQEKLAAIGQLAAGIAHEINNPLGFISSNFITLQDYIMIIRKYLKSLEVMIEQLKAKSLPEVDDWMAQLDVFRKKEDLDFLLSDIDDIFKESTEGFDRMMSLIENLKAFARTSSSDQPEAYDLNDSIERTLIVARNEIKYAANVEKHFGKIPKIECKGDEINQVLLNILVNAAQAIKSQHRQELGNISIKTYLQTDQVFCEITDNGPGIPKQILAKIFEPFFTTKEVGKGTGLGLSISRDIIINRHGGELIVQSEEGKGAQFIIKLPIKSYISK
jgi:two-component system, NtrC family, sensor kinase